MRVRSMPERPVEGKPTSGDFGDRARRRSRSRRRRPGRMQGCAPAETEEERIMRKSIPLLAAAAIILSAATTLATTIPVTNVTNAGAGSLRDAILLANSDVNATSADPDTIIL